MRRGQPTLGIWNWRGPASRRATPKADSEAAAAGTVLTADGAGGVAWQAVADASGKKYVALLAQSDEDPPVVTVLENSLSGTIVWTRLGYATYRATLTAAFPAGKTLIKTSLGRKASDCWWAAPQWLSEDTFNVYTTDNSGSLLEGFQELQVEVFIYP